MEFNVLLRNNKESNTFFKKTTPVKVKLQMEERYFIDDNIC